MESLAVYWSGGAILSWTAPSRVDLLGVASSYGGEPIVISTNPTIQPSEITAQSGITDHLIFYIPRGNGFDRPFYPFSYAAREGETIYFSSGGAASLCLLYDPISAE